MPPDKDNSELWKLTNETARSLSVVGQRVEDHVVVCGERARNIEKAYGRIERQVCSMGQDVKNSHSRINNIFRLLLVGLAGVVPTLLLLTYYVATQGSN